MCSRHRPESGADSTFVGRVELRDGPDYGHVAGSWRSDQDPSSSHAETLRNILPDLAGALLPVAAIIAGALLLGWLR